MYVITASYVFILGVLFIDYPIISTSVTFNVCSFTR